MRVGGWGAADRQVFERAAHTLGGPPAETLCRYLDEHLLAPGEGRADALGRAEIERAGERELARLHPACGPWARFCLWCRRLGHRPTRHELRSLANVLAAPVPEEVGRAARAGLFRLARAFADRPLEEMAMVIRALPSAWQALARAAWEGQRGHCPETESQRVRREFAKGAA